jgi:hypothetical protein
MHVMDLERHVTNAWEITLAGKTLTVRWGRLATHGQSKVKQFIEPLPAAKLPKLRRLKISYATNIDMLAQMSVMPQLEGLDLVSVTRERRADR